jgi:gliding motility-associated transport system permease protein/gliding motility-associatede transport system auxiliary component
VATNSVALRVAQKEIRLFFASPVAWLFLATFAGTSGFIFFWVESFFARNIADIRPLFEWMPIVLIFLCASLTMRMWSEERNSGTLEHVLTQPVPVWHFVLGKFLACLFLLLLALASTLPLPVTVSLIANLDWGPVFGGYLATVLLGATYLAIGLYVSARTSNPIASLIGTVVLCSALYLLGSPMLTSFFDDRTAEMMRLLGSGARFESINRGIIDQRDLLYYVSLCAAFLALNVFALEKGRWARRAATARQRHWRAAIVLLMANLVLVNVWLAQLSGLRTDLTEARLFSISKPTQNFLDELQEPLLIRGYFSGQTHTLLAPLVPQIRDLLKEYEVAGKGKVRVEFVDPTENPAVEKEANQRYGISATPFKIADRHQSTLVNAYFNILVEYGSEHKSLGFADLIEVRASPNATAEVKLRNPEYDVTHAIKKVLSDYRSGGSLFDGIEQPVEMIGYVSADELLPAQLLAYKEAIVPQLEYAAEHSDGKFSVRFIEPEARDGAVARQIIDQWGFKPMVTAAEDTDSFFFYLTLADSEQVVELPTADFDPDAFRLTLDAGLKRFAPGFTKIVALALPRIDPQLAQQHRVPTFANLERAISRDYSIRREDLTDGNITPEADILIVVAPQSLDEKSVFAVDQFLMRGGTVILATSPYSAEIGSDKLRLLDRDSGLQPWLAHNGLEIEKTLVLDKQNTSFHAPVSRESGDYEFRDLQLIDYPYFIDLRTPGLSPNHVVTSNLPQMTMAWASPIALERYSGRDISLLLQSSGDSWLRNSKDVMPSVDANGISNLRPPETADHGTGLNGLSGAQILGVSMQGRFTSYFADHEQTSGMAGEDDNGAPNLPVMPGPRAVLERSPESARIVLFSSNDFISDKVLNSLVTATGTQYLGPLDLFNNTLDWALQDEQLLGIRSRAHFNRTLPPMERQAQLLIEYFNYGLALLWLLLLALAAWLQNILRRRRYAKGLSL